MKKAYNFSGVSAVFSKDNNAAYESAPVDSFGMRISEHVEIRKSGRYLILKQEITTDISPQIERSYLSLDLLPPGTYKETLYAYYFKDVTPREIATPSMSAK